MAATTETRSVRRQIDEGFRALREPVSDPAHPRVRPSPETVLLEADTYKLSLLWTLVESCRVLAAEVDRLRGEVEELRAKA